MKAPLTQRDMYCKRVNTVPCVIIALEMLQLALVLLDKTFLSVIIHFHFFFVNLTESVC